VAVLASDNCVQKKHLCEQSNEFLRVLPIEFLEAFKHSSNRVKRSFLSRALLSLFANPCLWNWLRNSIPCTSASSAPRKFSLMNRSSPSQMPSVCPAIWTPRRSPMQFRRHSVIASALPVLVGRFAMYSARLRGSMRMSLTFCPGIERLDASRTINLFVLMIRKGITVDCRRARLSFTS